MASVKTVDFLPEIFQTPVNKQFLAATVDQLIQEPNFTKSQGFIGRRIGPGVDANDYYIVEPTTSRTNYQLEPGVVVLSEDRVSSVDAITYPGILDALSVQGADTARADRLFTSDYYCWDPFVDFDKLVNYAEYYWLPAGPTPVTVTGSGIPIQADIQVTRSNGYYTFDFENTGAQRNPTLTLVRGGNYNFIVNQNNITTFTYRVTNQGSSAYLINYQSNPTLTLVRGNTYNFTLTLGGDFPFWIKTIASTGTVNQYNNGVVNNGATLGQVVFTVPYDAPDTLFYSSGTTASMQGQFDIVDAVPGDGPKFWIQADVGTDGVMQNTPNISSRTVLGVQNNGIDLGTVRFNVPEKTAQNFFYTLDQIQNVDLISTLTFAEINNVYVSDFFELHPTGIDGTADLQNKTIVFVDQSPLTDNEDANYYGWYRSQQYSPVPPTTGVDQPGTYDVDGYSTNDPILTKEERYQIYTILYQSDVDGRQYLYLQPTLAVSPFQKFTIVGGTQYSNTQWFKNVQGYFEQIPLLTAALDTLFYQDGTDPAAVGAIRFVEQAQSSTIYVDDIIGKPQYTSPNGVVFSNGLIVQFQGLVEPASYIGNTYYVEGVGSGIKLLPTLNYVTPETYTSSTEIPFDSVPYDSTNYDVNDNQPQEQDYLTINRSSGDLNAWTRSNRWFHRNVIEASAVYSNTVAVFNQTQRAKRPILEFRAGLRLFDFGTQAIEPVDIIDFVNTDAFSNVAGQIQYNVDGYPFIDGTRVIFANDSNPDVRNRVYQVTFVTPDTQPPLIPQPVIVLTPTSDSVPEIGYTTVCLRGLTLQGVSFWFDGATWQQAQLKTGVNQAPLFDVYDRQGYSLADPLKYTASNFTGCKLFSYALGIGANDSVLGFPIKYLTINNVGDIVFDNNLYTDTFLSVVNLSSVTTPVSIGVVRQYNSIDTYDTLIGWQPAVSQSYSHQQFTFRYDGLPLLLDIKISDTPVVANAPEPVPSLKVYVASKFISPDRYTVTTTDTTTTIRLLDTYLPDDVIEVLAFSDQVSRVGFYEIPVNLQNNPLNANSPNFTLGTVRTHFESIGENLTRLVGPINGANNSRDLGNIIPYGEVILQQSSPLTLTGLFLRDPSFNVFSSIAFNSSEYVKYKNLLLDTLAKNDYGNMTTAEILTSAVSEITQGRTESNAFYWSDMLPAGAVFTQNTYTYTAISTPVFETVQTYDFTSSNYLGLNVYVNNVLLTRGYDFTVIPGSSSLTITSPLNVGDVIIIQEFSSTVGSFVPNTPTKLGLYPSWRPEIYVDTSYIQPTTIILGHDGSKTAAFGDFRDDVLLEFETRIFNNLKITSPIPIMPEDIIPGAFRTTDFSKSYVQSLFNLDFLSWVGWNKLDYTQQNYVQDNPFTWNYDQAGNKLTGTQLAGAWRGVYLDFYDTVTPNTTPWEMLGFTQQPTWWEDRYGPAPYTNGNMLLWDDLEAGLIADPDGFYINAAFARPGLTKIIPVGPNGELLSPFESVVGAYNPSGFRHSWQTGDYGPVEYSWRVSSSYPFAVMRLYALTRPAEFFSLFADRDLYKFDTELDQYLYNNRYRLDANGIEIYGMGQSKASYIDWIVDYNAYLGNLNAPTTLSNLVKQLDVRLCYRMAAFSDKSLIQMYLEKPTPASVNTSLLLPDSAYDLLLYKNQPFDEVSYSSIIVQRTETGFQVFGYSTAAPYFQIVASRPSGLLQTISDGVTSVTVPSQYSNDVVRIPYGYSFVNETTVVDFILSYGKFLEARGFTFSLVENGIVMNWKQMAVEFLYWANQGWGPGSLINLNPTATQMSIERAGAIVDNIVTLSPENQLQDQNKRLFSTQNLIIERLDNKFTVTSQNEQTISFINLRFTAYEHTIVMHNFSVFGDLIYQPITGARQNRIKLFATLTAEWNGQLNAQGFILSQDNIQEWIPNRKYTKGEIVLYKNNYYASLTIVQPSEKFNTNDWSIIAKKDVPFGLLPNISNKADQLANTYDVNSSNLVSDNDLLSFGLIGYRPRKYMASLDLNDISQVNVYKTFLGEKGTLLSIQTLSNASFRNEIADYTTYENWAILSGVYGAQSNRSYVDLQLNQALLNSNPSIVQLVNPGETSTADQAISINNIWSTSTNITNPDILPVDDDVYPDTSFPSAGYVNLDDVDIAIFSVDNPDILDPYLDQIGVGTSIWVAKINSYEWNIYRGQNIPGYLLTVTDNLDGTSIAQFSQQHQLAVGDIVIIKQFDDNVNGVYRVLRVPSLTSISIEFSFITGDQISAAGNGTVFKLQTMRVAQPSDIVNLPYATNIQPGAKVWVDNDGQGHWIVLQKNAPVTPYSDFYPADPTDADTGFGYTVAQRADNLVAVVGSPGTTGEVGSVTNYLWKSETSSYSSGVVLTLQNATGVEAYGSSTTLGGNLYGSAGAPASANDIGYASILEFDPASGGFKESQLLVALDQPGPTEFGYSVAMSHDERWLYIGSPGNNSVYTYGRVDVQTQRLTYVVTAGNYQYSLAGIQFDLPTQVAAFYQGSRLYLNHDYVISGTTLSLNFVPVVGATIVIQRSVSAQLDTETFFDVPQNSTSGLGTNALFNISLVRSEFEVFIVNPGYGYSISETVTINGTVFGGATPANDCVITITAVSDIGEIENYTVSGSFVPGGGLVNEFTIQDYIYSADGFGSITVVVDGAMQRPKLDYEIRNADSSEPLDSSQVLIFNSSPPAGAKIFIYGSTYFAEVGSITVPGLAANARFGQTISVGNNGRQVAIAAPYTTVGSTSGAGKVYVFDRYSIRQQVINANVLTYSVPGSFNGPVSVYLNDTLLNSTEYYNNGQYSVGVNSITFNSRVTLQVGDTIDIDCNQFELVQTLESNQSQVNANFGLGLSLSHQNSSLIVGVPYASYEKSRTGAVESFENQALNYGLIRSTVQNPTLTVGGSIRVNNYEVQVPNVSSGLRLAALASEISETVPNVIASVSNGYLTIQTLNNQATVYGSRLDVLPGYYGSTFDELGLEPFVYTQTILSPYAQDNAKFGLAVAQNQEATILFVGAPTGTLILPTTFDENTTTFDAKSTNFFDYTPQSGVVYSYDLLPSVNSSATNPGQWVFGQEIYDDLIDELDQFGFSVNYENNILMVGSPQRQDPDDTINLGRVASFINANYSPSWSVIRQEREIVDVHLINSVSMYDRLISTTNQFFDFFDPLQGKILGAAQRNIDYIGAIDAAVYNIGTSAPGNTWFADHLGEIWWDVSNARFIDPNTSTINYAARQWGQVFPGSSIDVYQWIQSFELPANYTGPGQVFSTTNYSVSTVLDNQGVVQNVYYYWVKNITTVATFANKTLSTEVIARYIEDPKSSGISYIAPVSRSAVAIYNGVPYISASDTILHIEYDQAPNDANVHTQYELIPEGKPSGFLTPQLYAKYVDSFSGITVSGAPVPDPRLPPAMRYGVFNTPRQNMFVNRLTAGSNFVSFSNRVLKQFPITELNLSFVLLNSEDPPPSPQSGEWNAQVANLTQLGWQNIQIQPVGYKYLVDSDSDNFGYWTIYTVVQDNPDLPKSLLLTKVQAWDTKNFWNYIDWYAADYAPSNLPKYSVNLYADLATLSVTPGTVVRVNTNSQGKWEIYRKDLSGWTRVALQQGTIAISDGLFNYAAGNIGYDAEVFDTQYFDYSPEAETRNIVNAINQEIFIDDLLIYRNDLLTLMFNYILSEQEAPSWLVKTSLLDVTHRIRQLIPYQNYRQDNQDFVLQYIQEVKPYHVQIKQFNLQYDGLDNFAGDLTDFDLPAFYDTEITPAQYVSPILDYNGAFAQNPSAFPPNAAIWQPGTEYNPWFENYLLTLSDIVIINGGSGYIFAPTVVISGTATRLGTAEVTINPAGTIASVIITDPGEGYVTTPTITLVGGSGTGGDLQPVMIHQNVRTFNISIKFDRYEYRQTFVPWEPGVTYDNGMLVSYGGEIWQADSPDSSGVNQYTFDPIDWILMPANSLSGVNRTMGYYVPTESTPGKVLPMLISGVDYPGVQVMNLPFNVGPGFDTEPYDVAVFDNIQDSPEGVPTYSDQILNTIFTSRFLDSYLGTRPNDINVEGGAFVDTFSSHAPEELVPGAEFDTLDLRVYTRPGSDWLLDGHGFLIDNNRWIWTSDEPATSFAGLVPYPVEVELTNVTKGLDLSQAVDYEVNWVSQTIIVDSINVDENDVLMVRVFELGGGNQLYRTSFIGGTGSRYQTIPVNYTEIQELAVFNNGEYIDNYIYEPVNVSETIVIFTSDFASTDFVSLTAIGVTEGSSIERSWSTPQTQYIIVEDPNALVYALDNSIQGTNPDNLIVTKNGIRARPPQGVEYVVDGSTLDFALPTRGYDSQYYIADPDVHVYVDNQVQTLYTDYTVSAWDGTETRYVRFASSPPIGSRILIAVNTYAQYTTDVDEIIFRLSGGFILAVGDVIAITTWNDTSQQNMVTRLWRGPEQIGVGIQQAYDTTLFDEGDVFNEPGTFDYSASTINYINNFDLDRVAVEPTRLWVHLNGRRLVNGVGYVLSYTDTTTYLVLPFVIGPNDVVTTLMMTDSVVPEAMAFRIFQDMRGLQLVYRMTPDSTTALSQDLTADGDVIYVEDATKLGEPNVEQNVWGVLTVGAERIMYRYRDVATNRVYSLLRGTAGTAAAAHETGSIVYDMNEGNMLPAQYENYVVEYSQIADGTQALFSAPNIDLNIVDSSLVSEDALIVKVGGRILAPTEYTVELESPATVLLNVTPPRGVEVNLSVYRGHTWYAPGIDTPSDGVPLQETNTEAARFLRGL